MASIIMGACYEKLLRPLLFRLDPEQAHELAIGVMRCLGAVPPLCRILEAWNRPANIKAPIRLFGLDFPNAVGLAAGFDKNAVAWRSAAAFGFGHVELGTVTCQRQPGNPRPRIFRYPGEEALINRLGFNNEGAERVASRLAARKKARKGIPVGINLGKSRAVPLDHAAEDYLKSFELLADYADYISINVSSPNTPDLRRLQEESRLVMLLQTLKEANDSRVRKLGKTRVPLLVKIAPDLSYRQIDAVLETILGLEYDGIIASNTTLERSGRMAEVREEGGLSGRPLSRKSTDIIRYIHRQTEGKLPVIGVGGIMDTAGAGEKIDAGASLVQIYTGMVFRGPFFARDVAGALCARQREWI